MKIDSFTTKQTYKKVEGIVSVQGLSAKYYARVKKNLNIHTIVGMVLLFSKFFVFMNDVDHCEVHIYNLDRIK